MTHKILGESLREFRLNTLNKTLKEIEKSDNIKALSAFEHGRSTNYKHIFKYFDGCDDEIQIQELLNIIKYISIKHY